MESHVHIFDHVAQRHIAPEEGAAWMMSERWRENYERLYRVFALFMLANTVAWFAFGVLR